MQHEERDVTESDCAENSKNSLADTLPIFGVQVKDIREKASYEEKERHCLTLEHFFMQKIQLTC